MKNTFIGGIAFFLLVTFSAHAAIEIQTKIDPLSDHKWIKPYIVVKNTGSSINLNGMSINYYFNDANLNPATLINQIFYCNQNANGITFQYVPIAPAINGGGGKAANYRCKIQISANKYISSSQNFELQFGFHTPDWRVFNENDDWSYTINKTTYAKTDSITLIAADGTILAGIIPGTPTIATAAKATQNATKRNTAALSVLGADNRGEANLTYTWAATVAPSGAGVTFSDNGTNSAKNTTATFYKAGNYTFKVTLKDQSNLSTDGYIALEAHGVPYKVVVTPPLVVSETNDSAQFWATVYDDGNDSIDLSTQQSAFTWSLTRIDCGNNCPPTDPYIHLYNQDGECCLNCQNENGTPKADQPCYGLSCKVSVDRIERIYQITAKYNNDDNIAGSATFKSIWYGGSLGAAKEKIKHVIIIMQENRSFDHYFGNYRPPISQPIETIPDAITYDNGLTPSPFHTTAGGIMYGHEHSQAMTCIGDRVSMYLKPDNFFNASSGIGTHDEIMGYYTNTEIPAYWGLADNFVLQDHMFESVPSWSKPSHLYLFSCWSATCAGSSCNTDIGNSSHPFQLNGKWTWNSLANLLDQKNASWAVWQGVGWSRAGNNTTCDDAFDKTNSDKVSPDFWNPLQYFSDVTTSPDAQHPLYHKSYGDKNVGQFVEILNSPDADHLPMVNWIVPTGPVAEHSAFGNLLDGHSYVASIIKKIKNSTIWNSCAIFISWDDWGGYYDHVKPPVSSDPTAVDPDDNNKRLSFGIRVPGLLISPWARTGFVDQQYLSFDSYTRFIEDLFCDGERIATSDSRPVQPRETDPILGNLLYEFDFDQNPNSHPFPALNTCPKP